jgi:predicted PurR-regulated permease PerM
MNKNITAIVIFLGILILLGYLFYNILIFILLSIMFASLGSPLMTLFQKIKIKKKSLPLSVAACITLLALIGFFALGFYLLIPIIIKEIEVVSSIDPTLYTNALANWLQQIDQLMYKSGFLNDNESVSDIILVQMKSFIGSISISRVAGNIFSFLGSLFILLFSVIFLTFFALKDKEIFFKMIRRAIPNSFKENFDRILAQTRVQVVRYFTGVLIDNIILGVAIGVTCYFAGIPNALLIGFLAGIFNIIPYVGPFIAMGLGLAISITTLLPTEPTAAILSLLFWKMAIVFIVCKAIDTFVLTPVIFGKIVKAHPIEIFIVILLAGYVGGILGMIFAVPAYSMIRIVVKEFFGSYYFDEAKSMENYKF